MKNHNPGLAAVLSFFFAGVGQISNGQILKGLILMALIGCMYASVILIPLGLIIHLYSIYNAYNFKS